MLQPQPILATRVLAAPASEVPPEHETQPGHSGVSATAAGTALHSAVVLAGQPLKTGAVVSTTDTIWVQVVLLPQFSVAVQMRVMV
jgi:hypothetical protein